MTIEIANRLLKLRKESGLSQEELADKLGISRQAVSKWERAEASPDTDNLICLAKLYGISLDELLENKDDLNKFVDENIHEEDRSTSKKSEENKKEKSVFTFIDGELHISDGEDEVHINAKGIHVSDNKDDVKIKFGHHHHKDEDDWQGGIVGGISVLVIIAFLTLGFLTPWGWRQGWILFFIIPVVSSFITAIRRKRITKFAYPVLVAGLFCLLGLNVSWGWHPGWIIFLSIPVFYTIFKPIDVATAKRRGEPLDLDDDED